MNEVAEVERLYSREWWESRSNNELQALARGGLARDEGAGAHREIERRARELDRAQEHEAEIQQTHMTTLRLKILAGVFIAVLIALLIAQFVHLRGH